MKGEIWDIMKGEWELCLLSGFFTHFLCYIMTSLRSVLASMHWSFRWKSVQVNVFIWYFFCQLPRAGDLLKNNKLYFSVLVLRSESSNNLDILSQKLKSMQDIDELTKMVIFKKYNSVYLSILLWLHGCTELSCLCLRSSVLQASTRRGRWFEQRSDRSGMSSYKVSWHLFVRFNLVIED